MDQNVRKRNELLAAKVISGLESRGMADYYAADKQKALELAPSLIPEGSSVGMGGYMSAREIGLVDAIRSGNYGFEDHGPTHDLDVFLASTNAITEDVVLVNDALGF